MTKMIKTPWGYADNVERLSEHVAFYSTPSHGGYHVDRKVVGRIPAEWRAYAKRVSGSSTWYEEDCAWAAVALSFPELFNDKVVAAARETAEYWLPKIETAA